MAPGDQLEVTATDAGSVPDFQGWVKTAKHALLEVAAHREGRDGQGPLHPPAGAQVAPAGRAARVHLARARWLKRDPAPGGPRPLGQGRRPDALHRLPRLQHRLQVREPGPDRRPPHLREVRGRGPLPAGAPRLPGHALQPVRRAALRLRLPDRGDVPAPGRDRRLRQARVHRLQGLHRGVPVRRDLHQPRGPLGGEVQLLRAPARRRPRARLRRRVPDRGDRRGRPERRHLARVARRSAATRVAVRRPEKETRPKLFYKGAHQATLDPIAARRPPGGLFMWSEQGSGPQQVTSGHPGAPNNAAAAMLAYDVAAPRALGLPRQPLHVDEGHRGGRLPRARAAAARRRARRPRARSGAGRRPSWAASSSRRPCGLLILDLDASRALLPGPHAPAVAELARARRRHPLALRRRAGRALPGRAARRAAPGRRHCCGRALPLAVLAAVYTAWLFAQAKARDLWQSPLLPPQLLVQAAASRRRRAPARGRLRRARGGPAARRGSRRSRRSSTCCSSRARPRSRTRPRTRASPPAR